MSYRIRLGKEDFKFSGTHFTIFGPEQGERLHGHNYYVTCELSVGNIDPTLGLAFDFNEVKPLIREITAELDEYVLLPAHSPWLKVNALGQNFAVQFAGKLYQFPKGDVKILPICNVTAEELAKWIGENFLARAKGIAKNSSGTSLLEQLKGVAVWVEETRGQSVCWEQNLALAPEEESLGSIAPAP